MKAKFKKPKSGLDPISEELSNMSIVGHVKPKDDDQNDPLIDQPT